MKGLKTEHRRSPSWGAWIEMIISSAVIAAAARRSPSWGAWIEITVWNALRNNTNVAPPRGERGLKFGCC